MIPRFPSRRSRRSFPAHPKPGAPATQAPNHPGPLFLALLLALPLAAADAPAPVSSPTGPWDLALLKQVPASTWGAQSNQVREVYYDNVPYRGQPTRVFAYYATPTNRATSYPALLLVHGGAMRAVADWATFWANRGYAALAMDLTGHDAKGRMSDGGPELNDNEIFDRFDDDQVSSRWLYQAVAAVVRGHSWLAQQPRVDAKRVGVHGLSWGGVVTCIVAGLDDRLRVAAPVFGAGYLYEDSFWLGRFQQMDPAQKARWIAAFDPARYLPFVRCPILFANGATDFFFPPSAYIRSFQMVPQGATLSLRPRLDHGWIWKIPGADTDANRFLDAHLNNGIHLPRLTPMTVEGDRVSARVTALLPIKQAQLHFTTDAGPWKDRRWQTVSAKLTGSKITVSLPPPRPLTYYLSVTDAYEGFVSTPFLTAGADAR